MTAAAIGADDDGDDGGDCYDCGCDDDDVAWTYRIGSLRSSWLKWKWPLGTM